MLQVSAVGPPPAALHAPCQVRDLQRHSQHHTLPFPAQEEGENSCMLPQLWRQAPCLELGLPLEEGSSLQDTQPPSDQAPQAEQQEGGDEPGEEGKAAYLKEAAAKPETPGETLWTAAPAQGAVAAHEEKDTAGREGSEQKHCSGSGTTTVSPFRTA